jgi:uncharacterized protein (TIGR02145 family)
MIAEPDSIFPGDTVNLGFIAPFGNKDVLHFEWSCASGMIIRPTFPAKAYGWVASVVPGDYFIKLKVTIDELETTDSIKVKVLDTTGTFTDAREGHQYKWIKIGGQIWMAENLAYLPFVGYWERGSATEPRYMVLGYTGENVDEAKGSAYYSTYGALYNWVAATAACPAGWHLPSDDEWKVLEKHLGMSPSDMDIEYYRVSGHVGSQLKETGTEHWISPNNGATNSSGFTALPAGCMAYNIGYTGFGERGWTTYMWSATKADNPQNGVWIRWLAYHSQGMERLPLYLGAGYSVRCVKDD